MVEFLSADDGEAMDVFRTLEVPLRELRQGVSTLYLLSTAETESEEAGAIAFIERGLDTSLSRVEKVLNRKAA